MYRFALDLLVDRTSSSVIQTTLIRKSQLPKGVEYSLVYTGTICRHYCLQHVFWYITVKVKIHIYLFIQTFITCRVKWLLIMFTLENIKFITSTTNCWKSLLNSPSPIVCMIWRITEMHLLSRSTPSLWTIKTSNRPLKNKITVNTLLLCRKTCIHEKIKKTNWHTLHFYKETTASACIYLHYNTCY